MGRDLISLTFGIFLIWIIFVTEAASPPPLDLSQYPPNIIPYPDDSWITVAPCFEKWFSFDLTNFQSQKPFVFSISLSSMNGTYEFYVTEYTPQINAALNSTGVNLTEVDNNFQTNSEFQTCFVPGSNSFQTLSANGILTTSQFTVSCNVRKINYYVVVRNINSPNGTVYISSNYLFLPVPVQIVLNATDGVAEVSSQNQFSTNLAEFTDLWKWSFFYFDIPTIIAERPGSTISINIVNKIVNITSSSPPVQIHINRISPAIPYSGECDLDYGTDSYQFLSCTVVDGGRIFFTTVNPQPTNLMQYTVQLSFSRAPLLDLSLPPSSSSFPNTGQRIQNVGSMSIKNQIDYYVLSNTMKFTTSEAKNLQLFIVIDNVINGEVSTTVATNATVTTIPFSCETPTCVTTNGGCQFAYDQCTIPGTSFMVGVKVFQTVVTNQPLYYTVSAVLLPIPLYSLSLLQGYVETVGAVEPKHILRYSVNHGLTGLPGQSLSLYLYTNQNSRGSVIVAISNTSDVGGCTFEFTSFTCNLYASAPDLSCSLQLLPCDLQTLGPVLYISVTGEPWLSDSEYYWHNDPIYFTMSVQIRQQQVLEINQIYDSSVRQGQWTWYSFAPFYGTLFLEVIEPASTNMIYMYLLRVPPDVADSYEADNPDCTLFENLIDESEQYVIDSGLVFPYSRSNDINELTACYTYKYFLALKASTSSSYALDLEYTITTGSITSPLFLYTSTPVNNEGGTPPANMINYEAVRLGVTGVGGLQLNDKQLNYTYLLDISTDQVNAGNLDVQVTFNLPECANGQSITMETFFVQRRLNERAECLVAVNGTEYSSLIASCSSGTLTISPCILQEYFISQYNDILLRVFFTPGTLVNTLGHQPASIIYTLVERTDFTVINLQEQQEVSIPYTPDVWTTTKTIFNLQIASNAISPPSNNLVYIEIMAPRSAGTVLSVSVYQVPDAYGLQCGLPYDEGLIVTNLLFSSSSSYSNGYLVLPFRACELYYRWNITNGYNLMVQTTFAQVSATTIATIVWNYIDETIPSVYSGLTFQNGAIVPISADLRPHVYQYFSINIGAGDLLKSLVVSVYSDDLINVRHPTWNLVLLVNTPAVTSGSLPNVDCGCYQIRQTVGNQYWYVVDPCLLMEGTYTFGVVYGTDNSATQEISHFSMQDFPSILPKYTAVARLDDLYVPLDIDFPANYIAAPNQEIIFTFTITPSMLGTSASSPKVIYFLGTTQLVNGVNNQYVSFRLTATQNQCSCPTTNPFPDVITCNGLSQNCMISLPYCKKYNGTIYVVATAPSGTVQVPFTTQLVTETNQGSYQITPSTSCDQSDFQVYTIDSLFKMLYFDLQQPHQITVDIVSLQNGYLDLFANFGSTPPLSECNDQNMICSAPNNNPSTPFNCSFPLNCVQQLSIGISSLTNTVFSRFQPVTFSMRICDLTPSAPVTITINDPSQTPIPLLYPSYTANYSLSLSPITFTPDLVLFITVNVKGSVSITFIQKNADCGTASVCDETALPSLTMTCGNSDSVQDTCIQTVTNCMLPTSVNTSIPWYIQVTNTDPVKNASGSLTVTTQSITQNTLSLAPNKPTNVSLGPYSIQLVSFQITAADIPNTGIYTATLDTTLLSFQPKTSNNRTGLQVSPQFVTGNSDSPLPAPAFVTSYLLGSSLQLYSSCQNIWTPNILSNPGLTIPYSPYSLNSFFCPYASCSSAIPITVYGLLINMDKYNYVNVTFTGTITQTMKLYTLSSLGSILVNGSSSVPAVVSMKVPALTRGQYYQLTLDVESPMSANVYYKIYPAAMLTACYETPLYQSLYSPISGLSNQLLTWDACTSVDEGPPGYNQQVVIYSDTPSTTDLTLKASVVSPISLSVGGPTLSGTLSNPYNLLVINLNPSTLPTDPTAKIILSYSNTQDGSWTTGWTDNRNTFPSLPYYRTAPNYPSCVDGNLAPPPLNSPFFPINSCTRNYGTPVDYYITLVAIQVLTPVTTNITYHINATVFVDPLAPRVFPMSQTTVNITYNQAYYLNPPANNMTYYTIQMESVDGAPFTISTNSDGCISSWDSLGSCSGRCVFPALSCLFLSPPSGILYYQISWTPGNQYRQFLFNYTINTIAPISIEPNFVKGGSLTSGQAYFFHYNSSTAAFGSSNYWSPLTEWSLTFISDMIPCGGQATLYESWIVPGALGCPSVFNEIQFNFGTRQNDTWVSSNVFLVDIDYWIVIVPQWDLDINHVPLTFFIEVELSPPMIYVPIHENQIRQLNFSLINAPPDSPTCFPEMINNTISCADGCNPPSPSNLIVNIPPVTIIYEYLQTGSVLDDRIMFFSIPTDYITFSELTLTVNEGHISYTSTCQVSDETQSTCSIMLPTCGTNTLSPELQYEIEVTATFNFQTNNIYVSSIPPIYSYAEIPMATVWVERFAPPVTTIQGSVSLTEFYVDVQLANNERHFFKVLPPANYPTFVGYMFEITNITALGSLSVTETWDVCATAPSYYCGCNPNNSPCIPNTVACQNSPPSVCTDTYRYPQVNKLGSCTNNREQYTCQPWVVSTINPFCDFCTGLNTFFITASSTSPDQLVSFRLAINVLPSVPTPPNPPRTCVTIPPFTQLPIPYWRLQPYFYLPSLTPSGPDQYYFFQFTTNAQFQLYIIEYPTPFNTTGSYFSPEGNCVEDTGTSSLVDGINGCNLIYQPTPGSSAKPMIMVLFYNHYVSNSYYFYINESLQSVSSVVIQTLGTTYQSPSESVPCETPLYNLHYRLPSSLLTSVTSLLVEVVGNGVTVNVYETARSLSSVNGVMAPSQTPVASCSEIYDCRIILACTLETTANYFIEVNGVPNNLTVSSLGAVSPISLGTSPSYNTLTYNVEDPTQNQWLTYSFDTSSPPHPLASVEFYFTGDQNPWITLTSTSTSSQILTTEESCYLYNSVGNSESLIQVYPCMFSTNTPIYANVLPLVSQSNCISNAFQMSANWQSPMSINDENYLAPIYDINDLPFGSSKPMFLNYTFSSVEPEALLLVKGFDPNLIEYELYKGNLVQGATWSSSCSSNCIASNANILPTARSIWQNGFEANNNFANPRLMLDVYDVCFHCGNSYDTFYLFFNYLPANTYPVIQKILPTTISTTPVSQSIGDVTAIGLAYFSLNPLDTTKGQYIEIKVTSGFVMGVLYPSYDCSDSSWNPSSNLYRYKWCYEGETCRILMVEPVNFPLGSSYTTYYLRLYGAASFSVALVYSQTTGCGGISSSLAPYCNGYTYSSSVLVFDNQILSHDLYAGNLSLTIQTAFQNALDTTQLPAGCVTAIRNFACAKGFLGCDGNGLVTPMPASICSTIESACGTTMSTAGFPQFSCHHLNYTGNADFISLLVNSSHSILDSITFLLIILLATILLLQ